MQPLRESAIRQREHRPRRRVGVLPLLLALSAIVALVLAACSGTEDNGTDIGLVQTQEAARNAPPPTTAPTDGSPAAETPTNGGGSGGGDAAAGQQVAQANGCLGCHSIDGSQLVGPTWQGLYGSEVTLDDGSTVTADEAYITESIRNPNAKVHEGFPPVMQPFPNLSDADIANIIAFMQTLQ